MAAAQTEAVRQLKEAAADARLDELFGLVSREQMPLCACAHPHLDHTHTLWASAVLPAADQRHLLSLGS